MPGMVFDEGYAPIPGVCVIGIGYKARNGKDSALLAIKRKWPALVERFAFADDLYAYCRIEHGMTEKDAPLLQRVGSEKRQADQDIWIKSVYWKIQNQQPAIAVITDVRYPNELAMLKSMGALTINVERYSKDGSRFIADDRDPNHPSEASLDGFIDAFDVTVRNENSLPEFQDAVVAAVSQYMDLK